MDEYTPDVFFDLLGDLDAADCQQAVREVARRQPYVAPAEIRGEVRRRREQRLSAAAPPEPPAWLDPDDAGAYIRWLRSVWGDAAAGHVIAGGSA